MGLKLEYLNQDSQKMIDMKKRETRLRGKGSDLFRALYVVSGMLYKMPRAIRRGRKHIRAELMRKAAIDNKTLDNFIRRKSPDKMKEVKEIRNEAIAIRTKVREGLEALDELAIKAGNDKHMINEIRLVQAQLTRQIEIKQKAIGNEINNILFDVLERVKKEIQYCSTTELKMLVEILKDSSVIVGLIGKTPLIAQQFNSVMSHSNKDEKEKIKTIEVKIVDDKK